MIVERLKNSGKHFPRVERLNISQIYNEEASNLWKNNFEPVFKQRKEEKTSNKNGKDIGARANVQ